MNNASHCFLCHSVAFQSSYGHFYSLNEVLRPQTSLVEKNLRSNIIFPVGLPYTRNHFDAIDSCRNLFDREVAVLGLRGSTSVADVMSRDADVMILHQCRLPIKKHLSMKMRKTSLFCGSYFYP